MEEAKHSLVGIHWRGGDIVMWRLGFGGVGQDSLMWTSLAVMQGFPSP